MRALTKSFYENPVSISIAGILLVALALRLWGIWFGLPFLFHNDESSEVLRALQLGAGSYDFERVSKGGYFYVLFVEFGILFVILKIAGVVSSTNEFASYFIGEPTLFYLVGRATTGIIGTITVYFAYRIGKQAYTPLAGLFAAALLAANILHAELSHYITVDVPMVCLVTVGLYFGLKVLESGRTRDYLWAAFFAALAASTKLSSAILLLPLVMAHAFNVYNSNGDWRQYLLIPRAWQAVGVFLATYVILTPGILVNFGPMMDHFLNVFGAGGSTIGASSEETGSVPNLVRPNLFVFYAGKIVDSMTLPVFVLCTAGVCFAMWKRRQVDIFLLAFGISVYVIMSLSSDTQLFFPRYILPLIPVMAVLGGRLLSLPLSGAAIKRQSSVSILVVAVLLAAPVMKIAQNNHLSLQKDTRVMAHEWFDSHVDDGSMVFIEGFQGSLYKGTVPLSHSQANLRSVAKHYQDSNPGKAKYFRMALQAVDGKTFDLVGVAPDGLQPLEHYKRLGVQYFVLRPDSYGQSRLRQHWTKFVEAIRADSDYELAAKFDPVLDITPGPIIEIYRFESSNGMGDRN